MKISFLIILLTCLLVVFYQDSKHRTIHVFLPVLIFSTSCFFLYNYLQIDYTTILKNIGFFMLTLGFLMVYMSIKNKGFQNPFQNYFGLGDLFFYISIAPLFALKNYILYFIFSLIFSLVMFAVFRKKMNSQSIPLAGYAALLLFFFIAIDLLNVADKITLIG